MKPYPVLLAPIMRPLPWGGEKLKRLPGAEQTAGPVGEAWIMSLREGAVSRIENGPLAGSDLLDYFDAFPDALGAACKDCRFPLLIKIIDAADKLSVQVHPDDAYAAQNEKEPGKTETWYVIDSEPGSEIIAGLADGVSAEDATTEEMSERLFRKIYPVAGDVIFIPPGFVHSIGAGILLCEIQQNSDLTYRIFDFDRKWNGVPRQLHLQKAADCIINYSNDDIEKKRFSRGVPKDPAVICSCDRFEVRKLVTTEGSPASFRVKDDRFSSLTAVSPNTDAELESADTVIPLSFGSCVFLPAGIGYVTVRGKGEFLVSEI